MMRLYFYVEGQTERAYTQTVLRNHLAEFGVMVEGAVLAATRKRHGVVHRGGGRHYAPVKRDLTHFLRGQRQPDVRVTTMFDLYSLYSDFPGMEEAEKVRHLPEQRARALEAALAADLGDSRLIPHIQLHEFEAILFCDLATFEIYYDDCEGQIELLRQDVGAQIDTPEFIDDGQHSAPSKRIAVRFPDFLDRKPEAPVSIATMIDLPIVRAKCPHFDQWLTSLERLGSEGV